jgi:ER-bound oxygenase mpaB/B'/Rubber oxygenase, catalytic domain
MPMSVRDRVDRDKLPNPTSLAEFPFNMFVRLLADGDIRATAAQHQSFRTFADLGDPLADAVVAMIQRMPTGVGRRMFETAVDHGIDALDDPPGELVRFFSGVEEQPYWLDYDKLALAARVSMRTGVIGIGLALPGLALTGGYLASKADKPLVGTGDLHRMAPRRLHETAAWYIDVTSPGGLDRFAPGFTGTLRVRLMHALVRAAMHRRQDWDYNTWDTPVNQIQLAGTLMLFSLANLAGCQAMGMRFSGGEREAVFHFWRYVGLLMGVHPELVPTCEADTWRLLWLEADTEFLPDDDSLRLSQALHSNRDEGWPIELARAYLSSYSRLILGKTNADRLGLLDNKPLQAAVLATSAVNRLFDYRRVIPGMTWLSEELGQRARRGLIARGMAETGGDRTYRRHDSLAAVG